MTAGLVGRWVEFADVAGHFLREHQVTMTHSDFTQLAGLGYLEKRQGAWRWECYIFDQASFDKVVEIMTEVDAVERLSEPRVTAGGLPHIIVPPSHVVTYTIVDGEDE